MIERASIIAFDVIIHHPGHGLRHYNCPYI